VRPSWQVQFLTLLVLGFSFYMLHGSIQVFVTELAPQARGSAAALHSAFFFLGQALGPVCYGIGFAKIGPAASLSIGALLLAVTGIVCARWLRHRAPAAGPG
jgi:predicted MFS family arabinose efflux permease